jgi:hypothetical protein
MVGSSSANLDFSNIIIPASLWNSFSLYLIINDLVPRCFIMVPEEGEFVIIKDNPKAEIWYCAEVRKILADRFEVNYYTTATLVLLEYRDSSVRQKEKRLKEANFLRTWCLDRMR